MIAFVGDVHGQFEIFHMIPNDIVPKNVQVIQVGDFGVVPNLVSLWRRVKQFDKPIFFIDGNHEYFPLLTPYKKPSAIAEGLVYVPRGTVLNIDGIKIGFCGGGVSIDKRIRTPGFDWFPDEAITRRDVQKFYSVGKLDLLVTHAPPAYFIKDNPDIGDSSILQFYGYPRNFIDSNSMMVEDIWNMVGNPPLICGHMHKSKSDGRVRVLGVGEVFVYDPISMEL